jgi:hypothetical protein
MSVSRLTASNGGMINELERSWKEAVLACITQYSGNCLQGLRKTTNYPSCLDRISNLKPMEYKFRALLVDQPAQCRLSRNIVLISEDTSTFWTDAS